MLTSAFFQQATDPTDRMRVGLIGALSRTDDHNRVDTVWNKDPQTAQSDTITVDSAVNATTYTYTVQGITVSYTSDASATLAEIANGLAAAHNGDIVLSSVAKAVSDGIDTVTITADQDGGSYTISESDANLTLASVATAAVADSVPFGRALIDGGADPLGDATRCAILAQSTKFTAQAATLTYTYNAAEVITVTVKNACDGQTLATIVQIADTDADTTAAAIEAKLAAALPANTVDETVASNVVTLTAEVAGYEFSVEGYGSAGGLVIANTVPASSSTSLCRAFVGMSLRSRNDEALLVGDTESVYGPNVGMKVLREGWQWVERPGVISYGAPVYVELAPGATAGRLYATAGATRVQLPSSLALWERDSFDTTDNVAEVRLGLRP